MSYMNRITEYFSVSDICLQSINSVFEGLYIIIKVLTFFGLFFSLIRVY
jgi:hypothetical protein